MTTYQTSISSTTPPQRPTTPLRPSSRTSFRHSANQLPHQQNGVQDESPLDSLEPQFAELGDSLADLESNLQHLQLMHESLNRFSENFAAFLYGLEMNAFVVDWPEAPGVENLKRWAKKERKAARGNMGDDTTILGMSRLKTPTKSAFGGVGIGTGRDEVDSTLLSDTTFASLKTPARRRTVAADNGEDGGTRNGIAATARGGGAKSGIPARMNSSASRGSRGVSRGGNINRGRGRGTG